MRYLYFTDLHVHAYKQFDVDGSRIENTLKVLDDVFKCASGNGITTILFGGDLVDAFGLIPTIVILPLLKRLKKLFAENPDITIVAITGNHDQATKSLYGKEGVSFLSIVELVFEKNFILIDNSSIPAQNIEVTGIPYYENPEHYHLALADAHADIVTRTNTCKKVLLIHQTPTGLGNPNIPTDTDVNDPLYDAWDLVLCGHIHGSQEITPKFWLGGTALHRDLGDEGHEKGFWIFDGEDPAGTMTFITRKGRYPEYIKSTSKLLNAEDVDSNFIVPQIETEMVSTDNVEMENFSSALQASELLENYWKQADTNKDETLLKTGLEFIK